MSDSENTVFMLPVINQDEKEERKCAPSSDSTSSKLLNVMAITIDELKDLAAKFSNYELETIEINVNGIAKSDGITKLFVDLSGEAGLKLVFKKQPCEINQ